MISLGSRNTWKLIVLFLLHCILKFKKINNIWFFIHLGALTLNHNTFQPLSSRKRNLSCHDFISITYCHSCTYLDAYTYTYICIHTYILYTHMYINIDIQYKYTIYSHIHIENVHEHTHEISKDENTCILYKIFQGIQTQITQDLLVGLPTICD